MAQMTKAQTITLFESAQKAAGRGNCLSVNKGGWYEYAWMRDQFEGWLLCAINADLLPDTPENRSLELRP